MLKFIALSVFSLRSLEMRFEEHDLWHHKYPGSQFWSNVQLCSSRKTLETNEVRIFADLGIFSELKQTNIPDRHSCSKQTICVCFNTCLQGIFKQ